MLVLMRLSGFKSHPVNVHVFPAKNVGEIGNTGYTILAAAPIAYIMRIVEKFTGEPFE
jgi:hypothetical protein